MQPSPVSIPVSPAPQTVSPIPRKCCVLGVHISATSYQQVVDCSANWMAQRRNWLESGAPASALPGRYICVTSVHGVMTARQDGILREILNSADIATPDGVPLVWALRSFGMREQTRVYGPNLMVALCERAARDGYRVFLYGGREEYLSILKRKLMERFPTLNIVGAYSPPFRPLTAEEDAAVKRQIQHSGADLVFVGISTPKQEHWMHTQRPFFPGVVMVGVGAAFDFHAGRVKQAPAWMQRMGMEWFFRLTMEPKRLWKRYLLVTPLFLPLWGMQKAGLVRFESE